MYRYLCFPVRGGMVTMRCPRTGWKPVPRKIAGVFLRTLDPAPDAADYLISRMSGGAAYAPAKEICE